jgi:hypothetical protein
VGSGLQIADDETNLSRTLLSAYHKLTPFSGLWHLQVCSPTQEDEENGKLMRLQLYKWSFHPPLGKRDREMGWPPPTSLQAPRYGATVPNRNLSTARQRSATHLSISPSLHLCSCGGRPLSPLSRRSQPNRLEPFQPFACPLSPSVRVPDGCPELDKSIACAHEIQTCRA